MTRHFESGVGDTKHYKGAPNACSLAILLHLPK